MYMNHAIFVQIFARSNLLYTFTEEEPFTFGLSSERLTLLEGIDYAELADSLDRPIRNQSMDD